MVTVCNEDRFDYSVKRSHLWLVDASRTRYKISWTISIYVHVHSIMYTVVGSFPGQFPRTSPAPRASKVHYRSHEPFHTRQPAGGWFPPNRSFRSAPKLTYTDYISFNRISWRSMSSSASLEEPGAPRSIAGASDSFPLISMPISSRTLSRIPWLSSSSPLSLRMSSRLSLTASAIGERYVC